MATWKGNAMLVAHKCGCKLWLEWISASWAVICTYANIGGVLWVGDAVTVCPECKKDLTPFCNGDWGEV